jgi:hypothetical protein
MGYAARFLRLESDVSKSVCLVLLVLLPAIASAQDQSGRTQPLQELFFTEVVYPQSKHELQLTLGRSWTGRAKTNQPSSRLASNSD